MEQDCSGGSDSMVVVSIGHREPYSFYPRCMKKYDDVYTN